MELLNKEIENKIKSGIINIVLRKEYDSAAKNISSILDELHARIPHSKRVSYGIVYVIRLLSEYLYVHLTEMGKPVFRAASNLFEKSDTFESKAVALGILSFYGLENCNQVLPYFELAASSSDWNMREFAQMFFRKLIKKYPREMHKYLLQLSKSEDANIRRFVSETLRPVQENRWFNRDPEYPISILRHMFRESSLYPRTSVGNNLSDLARKHSDLVFRIVIELVKSADDNSYRIAYRACRNLVKKEPIKVMDLLGVDEYKYKQRIYKRSDYQRD